MLQLKNNTSLEATLVMVPDPHGIDSVYAIMKGTFVLQPSPVLADEQLPLAWADQHHGAPQQTSLKQACDITLVKPGTDVLLHGTAYAPRGGMTRQMEISLRVGPVEKRVLVVGDRAWRAGVLTNRASDPEPFEFMPLVWERAFGGCDQTTEDPPQLDAEPRNPVGTGFCLGNGQLALDGLKLPNLEHPDQPVSSWKDRPTPMGVSAVCPHWQPRRSYAGTYDQQWQNSRAPYLPTDFDPRFFQCAPEDQVVSDYLKGGEEAEVTGVTRNGRLEFRVPEATPRVTYRIDGQEQTPAANLDTLLIEPDESRLVLTWRSVLACDKKTLRVREVEVAWN